MGSSRMHQTGELVVLILADLHESNCSFFCVFLFFIAEKERHTRE
jgi:hypothetical protein